MPERLVILLQRALNGPPRISVEEPSDDPDAEVGVDLLLDANELTLLNSMKTGPWGPDVVAQVGTILCNKLRGQPAINRDFAMRLAAQGVDSGPIYLRVEPPEIDEWPWEALNQPDTGFLALNKRWPIARVKRVTKAKSEYVFVPPLRILAVLGASGPDPLSKISARDEWDELYLAVRNSGLNASMRVFVCEDDLRDHIEQLQEPWITVGFIEDENELFRQTREFAPQLVHFFCHGIADTPPPFLQIASRLDWKRNDSGSVNIEASQLRDRADPGQNVWLITLNCCESAQPAQGSNSRSRPMASSLVLRGFPAVVGMRQRVDSQHASRFCGLWHETLLGELTARLQGAAAANGGDEFHWGTALFAARQGICSLVENVPFAQSAPRRIEWTIPVLYAASQRFTIRLAPDPDGAHPVLRPAAPPAGPAAPARIALPDQLRLVAEMKELLATRDALAGQNNLPELVRKNVLAQIDSRLTEIGQQLT